MSTKLPDKIDLPSFLQPPTQTPTKAENENIWDESEKTFLTFKESDTVEVSIPTNLEKLEISSIKGKFGTSKYITVVHENKPKLLKVDSIRLRIGIAKACMEAINTNNRKFPLTLIIKRVGSGLTTSYEVKAK